MSPELEQKLYNAYPEIFRERGGSPSETAMCWGICCGDGWYGILNALCSAVYAHCLCTNSAVPAVRQVKQKFGLLCFSVVNADVVVRSYTEMAVAMSGAMCEVCGAHGDLRADLVFRTLCDGCAAVRADVDDSEDDYM